MPCDNYIIAGPTWRKLQYLKDHISRPLHRKNTVEFHDMILKRKLDQEHKEEERGKETADEEKKTKLMKMREAKEKKADEQFSVIEQKYPGTFVRESTEEVHQIVCQYCTTRIFLLPERGDVLANVDTHVSSIDHKKRTSGQKQSILSSFFKKK